MSRDNVAELIIKLYDELSAPARAAAASIKGLTSDFQRSQNALESWSRQVKRGMADAQASILKTALAAGALYVAMAGPIRRAGELAESLKTLQINTNRSEEGMVKLQERFKGLARSLNMDMKQFADGANLLPKKVKDVDETLEKTLTTVGRFSRAMNTDFAESLRVVKPLMGQLRIEAEDLPRAFDLITKAQRRFGVPVGELMENLPRLAEEMDSLKMRGTRGLGQALSVISAITERTGDASAAMTAFTRVMEKGFSEKVLKSSGINMAMIIKKANESGANPVRAAMQAVAERVQYIPGEEIQKRILQDFFGPRFALGARSMIEMLKTIDKTTREVFDSQGEIDKAFKIRMMDWTESWRALRTELGLFQDVMGGVLGNALRPYVDMLHSATIWITNFTKAHPGLVAWLAKAAIGLTALSLVLGVIRLAFWGGAGIIAAFAGAAVTAGGLIALLPALAAGFASAAAAFFLFRGAMKAWGYLKDFASGVGNVMGAIFGISSAHAATNNMAVPDTVRHPLSAIQDHTQETVNVITQLDHTIRMRIAPFWYGTAAGRGFGGSSGPGGGGGGGGGGYGGGSGYGGSGSGGGSGTRSGPGGGGSTGSGGAAGGGSGGSGPMDDATANRIRSAGNIGSGVKLEGISQSLGTKLADSLEDYQKQTGKKATLTSGFRTHAQQEEIWERSHHGKDFAAAPPGRSKHESGNAVDISANDARAMERMGILKKHGLNRPMGERDAVHIQEIPGTELAAGGGSGSAVASNPSGTNHEKFMQVYDIAKKLGDPYPEVTAAQWANESAWGTRMTGTNNPFGQTGHSGRTMGTPNDPGGGSKTFVNYPSLEAAISDHIKKWGGKTRGAANAHEALMNLQSHGGAPRYAQGFNNNWYGYVTALDDIMAKQGMDPKFAGGQVSKGGGPIKTAMKGDALKSSLSNIHAKPYVDDTHLDDAIAKAERLHSLMKMNNPSSFHSSGTSNEHSIYRSQNHRLMSSNTQGS